MKKKLLCSIGICVYNEEKNIEKLLQSLLTQQVQNVLIDEILVIASGSTDGTCDIVKKYEKMDQRIKLLKQFKREGKASAVNMFIQIAKSDILILTGGDIILAKNTINQLVNKFSNEDVGMTGARPIPINDINEGVCGFAAHFLWNLHHRVSLKYPKMGETIAFRKIFKKIPVLSSVDEANIEPLIRGQGYKILYVPKAKVYNKAPTTIHDFIQQRRRIYSGHLAVKYEQSYVVSTMQTSILLEAFYFFIRENFRVKYIFYIPVVISLEALSRGLGWWDYRIAKKRHTVWKTIQTTKDLDKRKN